MDKAGTKRMKTYGSVTKKGVHRMHLTKIFILIGLSLAIGLFGCTAAKKSEAPKQEQVTKDLVPPKAEGKGLDIQDIFRFIGDLDVPLEDRRLDDLFRSYVYGRDNLKVGKFHKKILALNLSLRWNQILGDLLLYRGLYLPLLCTTKNPNGQT